jgi:hypothetical protein
MKRLCIAILFPLVSISAAAQTCVGVNVTCAAIHGTPLKRMFEVVQGTSDGKNQSFQLTDVPFGNIPVRLFRNGLELRPGTDFTVQGKAITLSTNLPRQAGDVFQAAFSVEVGTVVPSRSELVSPTGPSERDLLSVYLNRALQRELETSRASLAAANSILAPVQTANEVATAASTLTPPNPILSAELPLTSTKVISSTPEPASLRMLTRLLAGDQDVETRASSQSRLTRLAVRSVQGSDGLGDIPFSDPFSVLADRSDGLSSLLDRLDSQSRSSSAHRDQSSKAKQTSRVPRALQMLQQKIESTQ